MCLFGACAQRDLPLQKAEEHQQEDLILLIHGVIKIQQMLRIDVHLHVAYLSHCLSHAYITPL